MVRINPSFYQKIPLIELVSMRLIGLGPRCRMEIMELECQGHCSFLILSIPHLNPNQIIVDPKWQKEVNKDKNHKKIDDQAGEKMQTCKGYSQNGDQNTYRPCQGKAIPAVTMRTFDSLE